MCNSLGDNLWYRAVCINTADKLNKYYVYLLDWGIGYLVNAKDIYKMSKDFVYLPAAAHKCYVKGNFIDFFNHTHA